LVVGRAGAGTVNELANLGKPSILIPLPGAKEQVANSHALEQEGGAVMIPQSELTPTKLAATINGLLADPGRLAQMGHAALKLSTPGAADRIISELLSLKRMSKA